MIATGKRVFRKYLRQQVVALIRGIPLKTADGMQIGYLDELRYFHDRVTISGWCIEDHLHLNGGKHPKPIIRNIARQDVLQARPDFAPYGPQLGFTVESLWSGEPLTLTIRPGNGAGPDLKVRLPLPSPARMKIFHPKAMARFALSSLLVAPGVSLKLLRGQQIDIAALRRHYGLGGPERPLHDLDESLFADTAPTPPQTAITILLPVYNAFDLVQECLRRVEANTDLPWHLIVVEDCSTDDRVRPWLRNWAAGRADRVTLIENPENLGFIGSVNHGFTRAPTDRPLVLLNSDALVPQGWAGRLIAPLLADPKVASVTPMSNDATIFSVPLIALSRALPDGLADQIDQFARSISPDIAAPAPTGVGFCMAMSAAARKAVPQFDTAFGKGYGEEVDWCQRTLQLGMHHLGIGNLFVEHRGGQSFGSDVKAAAMLASGRIITRRYPGFDRDVQNYIAEDPLLGARLALGLAWAAGTAARAPDGPGKVPVYIAHSLGGGAESWLSRTIADDIAADRAAVVLRLGGQRKFRIELHVGGAVLAATTDDKAVLTRLMAPLSGHHFVYSCGVGDRAGVEVPGTILDLAGPEPDIRVLFHDYWPISPSYTLVDSDTVFRGVPDPSSQDPVHQSRDSAGNPVSLSQWQAAWGRLIAAAQEVTVFSDSSAQIVQAVWPDAADRLHLRPHALNLPDLTVPGDAEWLADNPGTIAVLGGIGIHKGAGYVSRIAADFARRPDAPRLVVIGEFDLAFPLPSGVVITGRYQLDDLPQLIERYRVQAWLMPSIVPETFSYATHEMLGTGLPVLSFALGAQGAAVAQAPKGHILPDESPETLLKTFRQATGKAAA